MSRVQTSAVRVTAAAVSKAIRRVSRHRLPRGSWSSGSAPVPYRRAVPNAQPPPSDHAPVVPGDDPDHGAPVDRLVAPIRSTRLEIESLDELAGHLASRQVELDRWVLKALDLRDDDWVRALAGVDLRGVTFLGCRLASATLAEAEEAEALVFPPIDGLPFDPY